MPEGGGRDAVVVGSGPNGLAAAIALAQADRSVLLLEAEPTIGGGCRSEELTLPGFIHDVCSAIHPLAAASPFFASLPLRNYGLEWVHPGAPLAHPLDDGSAAIIERSVQDTAVGLGHDGRAYRRLMGPLVARSDKLTADLLGSFRVPRHPMALARFGLRGVRSARALAGGFDGDRARALIGGMAAHSQMPLDRSPTGGVALVLGLLAHSVGWPMARGGSQRIADALATHLRSLGGEVRTGTRVRSPADFPPSPTVLLDVTPQQLLAIAGARLPASSRRRLARFEYGPAVFKVDWALDGPVPWKAQDCARAATVHLGGTFEEIAASEEAVARGEPPDGPFVLFVQQSPFDPGRAPEGKHTAWAYCHVPSGSTVDMTERIEAQVERFAPGFRDLVLGRSTMSPADLERHNANYVGGHIGGGLPTLRQTFARPSLRWVPYLTPVPGLYLCSSSTPPGAGVHGMCGFHAAAAVLAR